MYLGITVPGRSRKGVIIYVPSLERVVIVRQCNLDATFLPYRRTNRRIKPFEDPGFPEALWLSREDQASMLDRISTDFPEAPPEHDKEGREPITITVPHSNDENAAALFSRNSPAGSGMVLPYQQTLSAIDTNSSASDRANASVRQGFWICEQLSVRELDGQGIRAFFETFRVSLLLPAYWFPRDAAQYVIRGHRVSPTTPYTKSVKNTTYMTPGVSTSNFDNWEVNADTGTIGELEIDGPKGLRAALANTWRQDESCLQVPRTSVRTRWTRPNPARDHARHRPFVNKKRWTLSTLAARANAAPNGVPDDDSDNETQPVPVPATKPRAQRQLDVSQPLPVLRSPVVFTEQDPVTPRPTRSTPSVYTRRTLGATAAVATVGLTWSDPIEAPPADQSFGAADLPISQAATTARWRS